MFFLISFLLSSSSSPLLHHALSRLHRLSATSQSAAISPPSSFCSSAASSLHLWFSASIQINFIFSRSTSTLRKSFTPTTATAAKSTSGLSGSSPSSWPTTVRCYLISRPQSHCFLRSRRCSTSRITRREDVDDDEARRRVTSRRISGWNFNEDGLDLRLVFPTESGNESVMKMVRFGGEIIIPMSSGSHESYVSSSSPGRGVEEQSKRGDESGESMESNVSSLMGVNNNVGGGVDREAMVGGLTTFIKSLDEQRGTIW